MYKLLYSGEFGNVGQQWATYQAFRNSNPSVNERYVIRSMTPGGRCVTNLYWWEIPLVLRTWKGEYNISVLQRNEWIVVQGEIHMGGDVFPPYPKLTYSYVKQMMRVAFQQQTLTTEGYQARKIIETAFDDFALETLNRLSQEYPNHIYEFSAYSRKVGTLGSNVIWWEVRQY